MHKALKKMRESVKQDGLTPVESGGIFLVNVIALIFFFAVAKTSTVFFFLYLAYVLNVGAHLYDRGLKGTMFDLKAFFQRVLPH